MKNPKLEGTSIWDCRPQAGLCKNWCNQCFYNRPGAFYCDINEPNIPDPADVGNGIVRMNCGHDSNIQKDLVLTIANRYKEVFFNTSIQNLDFPGPVVLTINPQEEEVWDLDKGLIAHRKLIPNLMFIRVRVSVTNMSKPAFFMDVFTKRWNVPVVLTPMAYYDHHPPGTYIRSDGHAYLTEEYASLLEADQPAYVWKVRHINSYWCPTPELLKAFVGSYITGNNKMIHLCGTADSGWCKDCGLCEHFYWITKKTMLMNTY